MDGVFTMSVGGSKEGPASKSKQIALTNTPSPRMKPGLAVCKGNLYLYGGEFESGSKQFTLNDFYSLGELNAIRCKTSFFYNIVIINRFT